VSMNSEHVVRNHETRMNCFHQELADQYLRMGKKS